MTYYYLFARPSFLEGIARIYDFGNTLNTYNYSNTPEQADYIAMASDWQVVGQELRAAVARIKLERLTSVAEEETLPS